MTIGPPWTVDPMEGMVDLMEGVVVEGDMAAKLLDPMNWIDRLRISRNTMALLKNREMSFLTAKERMAVVRLVAVELGKGHWKQKIWRTSDIFQLV